MSNVIPGSPQAQQPAIDLNPIPGSPQAQTLEQISNANNPLTNYYAGTPSMVPPSGQQAVLEQSMAQGSYPTMAGSPLDLGTSQEQLQAANMRVSGPSDMQATAALEDPSRFVQPETAQQTNPLQAQMPTVDSMLQPLGSAFDVQRRGIEAAADAGAKKAAEQAAYQNQLDAEFTQRQLKQQKMFQEADESIKTQISELSTLKDDYKRIADSKVDPENFWASRTTGQKVMAGIALALGAIGAGATGKNSAVEIIDKAIERDIESQKFNLNRQLQAVQGKQTAVTGVLNAMNQRYNNLFQAESAARILMLDQAKNKLDAISSKYAAPELKAKAQMLRGQLDAQQAKAELEFKAAAQAKAMDAALTNAAFNQYKQLTPSMKARLPKEIQEREVPGYGFAATKELANDFSKFRNEIEPALLNAKEVTSIVKARGGLDKLDLKSRAEVDSRTAILVAQLRLMVAGPGPLTDAEYQRIKNTVGEPNSFLRLNSVELKKLETVMDVINTTMRTRAAQAGLVPQVDNKAVGFKPER